ncbi:hypothetical protein HYPSUDRAFT_911330 [Hypholoma sublateritium FD-334 SS-4]|uniref:Uncharacterized protein n=1 Tax=Hypholoma sublateritium (strain FD-334 SS-4) TaxID=945553 RepID=A0A0D2NQ58_HYPSF|nr:hypothetical protein HYPSUDRAFT_911330 [Hypholoma sublateritium FD-334 SS-4]
MWSELSAVCRAEPRIDSPKLHNVQVFPSFPERPIRQRCCKCERQSGNKCPVPACRCTPMLQVSYPISARSLDAWRNADTAWVGGSARCRGPIVVAGAVCCQRGASELSRGGDRLRIRRRMRPISTAVRLMGEASGRYDIDSHGKTVGRRWHCFQ